MTDGPLWLPAPPTANLLSRSTVVHGRVHHYRAPAYKQWLKIAVPSIREHFPPIPPKTPVVVHVAARLTYQRDLDNCVKPLLDAAQMAGVLADDRYVVRLLVEREPRAPKQEQAVSLTITPAA